jgi:hypothetical protein
MENESKDYCEIAIRISCVNAKSHAKKIYFPREKSKNFHSIEHFAPPFLSALVLESLNTIKIALLIENCLLLLCVEMK